MNNLIHIRCADNLNFHVYWKKDMQICFGQLSMLIPAVNKLWTLNQDKTISPANYSNVVIGVIKKNETYELNLLKQDPQKDTI